MERTLRRRDVLAAASAGRLACNSYYSAKTILRAYARDAEVCYLGVDTETFSMEAGIHKARPPSAISVGAIERVKGHDVVVQALGLLPLMERPVLNLVYERCDDNYRAEVQSMASALGVDLRLHRGISDAVLATLYQSSTVTILAARLEPFGFVPLESLACGTPVVAVSEAGYRETVDHGVNGFLVGRSSSEIAEAIRRVIRGELRVTPDSLRAAIVCAWDWGISVKQQLEMLISTAEMSRR
jgi:glycosyltransferase involved in cell wall biosynthesis